MTVLRKLGLGCVFVGLIGGALQSAEIALVPVKATGGYAIAGNRITLNGGGQRVFLEIKVSGWDPNHDGVPQLKTWQADLDSSGYHSGAAGTLAPVVIPCTEESDCVASLGGVCSFTGAACLMSTECQYHTFGEVCRGAPCDYPAGVGGFCSPGFQSAGRPDGVLLMNQLAAVDVSTLDFRYGATLSPSGSPMVDPGTVGYGGTLVLEVPVAARGTFTVGFFTTSFTKDASNAYISPLFLTSAQIEIGCGTGADCDDGNPCTNDTCSAGQCVNTNNAASCNNGVFCDGADTCGGGSCSIHAGDPCAPNGCDEVNDRCILCPAGPVTFVNPQSGTVDARQPYPPANTAERHGISLVVVEGPSGINNMDCWGLCETRIDGTPNTITGIVDNGNGTFNVNLARTISIGAVTTLTYTDGSGIPSRGVFTSHPANVDADNASGPVDILAIIDILNLVRPAPWGNYSCDADQSGVCGPADILRVIDLLNGADALDPWLGQALPACGACCP